MSFVKDILSATGIGGILGLESGAEKAAKEAAGLQAGAAEAGIAETRRQFDITQEQLAPFQQAGISALEQQQALIGLGGQEAQQQAFSGLEESRGQQFLRARGQRNLLRNAAAIGGIGGGNVREALVQQGVGFAQQDIQNQFGRLGQIAGQGQTAATNIGQFGQQTGANVANLLGQGAQARASGILGAQQAKTDQFGNLIQLGATAASFSDKRLKNNIKKVGEFNGHNWYTWTWNGIANKLGLFGEDNGVIADEVQKTKPHLIKERSGFLTVNYAGLGV